MSVFARHGCSRGVFENVRAVVGRRAAAVTAGRARGRGEHSEAAAHRRRDARSVVVDVVVVDAATPERGAAAGGAHVVFSGGVIGGGARDADDRAT